MICFVEGCTCSGKTTFCKEFLEGKKDVFKMAKKHTPPIIPNENPLDRQSRVFQSFMQNFEEMLNDNENYIADYSPAGVIPFTFALADTTKDLELQELLQIKSVLLINEWHSFYMDHFKQIIMLKYLKVEADTIIERLQNRQRAGDNMWPKDFIYSLVKEYDNFFSIYPSLVG